jgi:hypothetical protein
MTERDDMNVPMITGIGVISVAVTVATIFAVQAIYVRYTNAELERKVVQVPAATSDSKLAEQEAKLSRYSWVDRSKGVTTIPVERAMQLVVREMQTDLSDPTLATPEPSGGK